MACALVSGALLASPGAAAVAPSGEASVTWPTASGAVSGYVVFVYRDGSSIPDLPALEVGADEPRIVLTGSPGSRARIQVAAFDSLGRLGSLSPLSEEITFDDSAPPRGGSETEDCGQLTVVEGRDKIRVRDWLRDRGRTSLATILCSTFWTGADPDGREWSGDYDETRWSDDPRKARLRMKGPTTDALISALRSRLSSLNRRMLEIQLREEPRLRAKRNRSGDRIKWLLDVKIDTYDPRRQKRRPGSYRFELIAELAGDSPVVSLRP